MVIDTSAMIAILLDEPERAEFLDKMRVAESILIGAPTWVELSMVGLAKVGFPAIDSLLAELRVEVVPFDAEQAVIARRAFERYGKGRDKAGLNMGDCFSYALARQLGEPLLYKGNDFIHTDLTRA